MKKDYIRISLMGMVREGIVQCILEIVLWRMIKLRRFLIKNTSHFIVLLIQMMPRSNWNVQAERTCNRSLRTLCFGFLCVCFCCPLCKEVSEQFFPFLRHFILLLIPDLALLKYTTKWEPDHWALFRYF